MKPHEDSLARFCHQYLQLEKDLDYPGPDLLREESVQDSLYKNLFAEGAVPRPTPQRYHLRVLKELLRRIEASIDDWDKHVCIRLGRGQPPRPQPFFPRKPDTAWSPGPTLSS
jgi:hypothetical protein